MRTPLFLILSILFLVTSCAKFHQDNVSFSKKNLTFTKAGDSCSIDIFTNCDWKIRGTNAWCTINKSQGTGDDSIVVVVHPNMSSTPRSTKLILTGPTSHDYLYINQEKSDEAYHYQLPVIFHILHSGSADRVSLNKITALITKCNELYTDKFGSINTDIEVVAAIVGPTGDTLSTPGVEYIQVENAIIDCEEFMKKENPEYAAMLWDPNQYINIFVYKFTDNGTSGISHLPYTPEEDPLAGLTASNKYYTELPKYPHSICLNNKYIDRDDAGNTLAHELGHYLGLYHVFVSKATKDSTDYCDDTPNYDRDAYEAWLNTLSADELNSTEVYKRTSLDEGLVFTSENIMDYYYSYQNKFTTNQMERFQHVLANSPMIPGRPTELKTSRSYNGETPPIRYIK